MGKGIRPPGMHQRFTNYSFGDSTRFQDVVKSVAQAKQAAADTEHKKNILAGDIAGRKAEADWRILTEERRVSN